MMVPFPKKAIVLAAGLGLRMRPLTEHKPKPLVEVAGRTLIDRALDFAADGGVQDTVVNASYKAEMLEAHIQARTSAPNVTISREAVPLETGGGVRDALPLLHADHFFSINGDIICVNGPKHALHALHAAWDDEAMDALLLLHPLETAVGFDGPGDFFLEKNGVLIRRGEQPSAPYVFTGIQLMHRRLFDGCPPEGPFSLNVLYNRNLQRIRGIVHDGAWLHVGDIPGLHAAETWLSNH